ncbi:MAG: T9SS type A sorting domain-containing protein, partial [Bacteroidia bacterium]
PTSTVTYSVVGTNANGCSNSAQANVYVNAVPATPTISANGFVLSSSSASGNQWYLNGVAINGATSQTYSVTQNGNYSVIVTNLSGCDATSNVVSVTSMGISSYNSTIDLSIFPNPANGMVTMTTNGNHELITVEITSSIGQIVLEEKIMQCGPDCKKMFDLSGLANGIYVFKVKTNNVYVTKQLVIQN